MLTRALFLTTALLLAGTMVGSSRVAAQADGDDLPAGEGKKILQAACTSCHALNEVTKFGGFYNRSQWRDVVVTMVEYGAPLDTREVDTLADYLALHFGKKD